MIVKIWNLSGSFTTNGSTSGDAMRWQTMVAVGVVALGLALAGCGGGGGLDGSGGSTTPSNQSAAGIWSGTDSAGSGLTIDGFINSAGQANFIRSDGVQFVGTAQVSGTALTISVSGYANFGTTFSGGSASYGLGNFTGTVTTGTSATGTLTFTPTGDSPVTSTWTLNFNALYNNPSSLAAVSGNYTSGTAFVDGVDPMSNAAVSITTGGMISGQGTSSGCVMNGAVTVPNGSFNIYQISYTLQNCVGSFVALNNVSFSGQAVLNPASGSTPTQVVIGATGQASDGTFYGLATALTN
jgi:hypothetical protein